MKTLTARVPEAGYGDLVLIICAVISACAVLRWRGKGRDRKRFVELLVKHSPSDFHASWVSVPVLLNDELVNEEQTPYARGNETRIFRSHEVDLPIEAAERKFPDIDAKDLRRRSYACLIHEWLRCGYSHEYRPHADVTHVPASREVACVSYIGRLMQANIDGEIRRMVSFHIEYLIRLAEHHVNILPDEPSAEPPHCWIDDG